MPGTSTGQLAHSKSLASRETAIRRVECASRLTYIGYIARFKHTGQIMFLPALSDTEKKVLVALLDRNNIAGYDLMSMTGGNFDDLRNAVANLRKNDLIQVVGSSSTEKDFQFSRFAVLPSAKSFASALTR